MLRSGDAGARRCWGQEMFGPGDARARDTTGRIDYILWPGNARAMEVEGRIQEILGTGKLKKGYTR